MTEAYSAAGIVLVPGRNADSVTPNMLLGDESVLADVTSPDLLEEIPILGEEDRRAFEAMTDRDKNIKGTEIDENRQIEQEMIRIYGAQFSSVHNYPDGKRRRLHNLAEMLRGLSEMKPDNATLLSDRLADSLESAGYFEIFTRAVSKSHIPTWTLEVAKLWYSDRREDAMALIDRAYEVAVLYRVTAQRLRDDADAISPQLASRLSVLKMLKEKLIQNAETLESYCEKAEKFKRLRETAFPTATGSE